MIRPTFSYDHDKLRRRSESSYLRGQTTSFIDSAAAASAEANDDDDLFQKKWEKKPIMEPKDGRTSTLSFIGQQLTRPFSARSFRGYEGQKRSMTAFDIKQHYSHKSIYSTSSSSHALKRRKQFLQNAQRSKSTVNFVRRPYSTYSTIKTPANAQDLDLDEDELKPPRSFWKLAQIGILYFGIEVLFSLETALTVPILLKLKVPESVYSLVYFISPLIGFILQPVLGVMSDRCQWKFGRRRPFILILAIGSFLGITLILNGFYFGQLLGDKNAKVPLISIILTGLGVTFLDFSADSSDSPLRALLLDVCNSEDQETGLNIHAFLGGTGSAVGFVLAAVDWSHTFLRHIGNELQILYMIASVIFIATLVLTLTSVKETPLVLTDTERVPLVDKKQLNDLTNLEELREDESETILAIGGAKAANEEEEEEDDSADKPITLRMLFSSVLNMPQELLRLLICQILGWLAYFSVSLFFTDFIAQAIYHGDPYADTNSTAFQNYNEGIKYGCWGMLACSVFGAVFALIFEKVLLEKVSTRTLYFGSYLVYGICTGAIFFMKSFYTILPLYTISGIITTAISTLPYQMLAEFHEDKAYKNKSSPGTKRGLGIDCSLLSSIFFLAQTLVSAFMSPMITAFGQYTIVVMASLFSLFGCLWIALFVIYPKNNAKTRADEQRNAQN